MKETKTMKQLILNPKNYATLSLIEAEDLEGLREFDYRGSVILPFGEWGENTTVWNIHIYLDNHTNSEVARFELFAYPIELCEGETLMCPIMAKHGSWGDTNGRGASPCVYRASSSLPDSLRIRLESVRTACEGAEVKSPSL